MSPLLLGMLITNLESGADVHTSYLLTTIFALAALFSTFLLHRNIFALLRIGMSIRVALMNVIYRKVKNI